MLKWNDFKMLFSLAGFLHAFRKSVNTWEVNWWNWNHPMRISSWKRNWLLEIPEVNSCHINIWFSIIYNFVLYAAIDFWRQGVLLTLIHEQCWEVKFYSNDVFDFWILSFDNTLFNLIISWSLVFLLFYFVL